ncbi:DUF397 domain-containing protein [Nocardia sp. alder85J]|uniref:DUF397 domain-containing protein n=1 Tax=Nocardia sp. alder85J TaxID=2862949 RepID=UPI001CD279F1|nr:DUF397 domain-containing protein [Nocardia sp. alder85J]MCX4097672.1 DUF397 domain-containing protein [Nocardia sp. alder85J]
MNTEIANSDWFKSTFSETTHCVEVAWLPEGGVGVRDSKNPGGPALVFTGAEWSAFTSGVKAEEFDRTA